MGDETDRHKKVINWAPSLYIKCIGYIFLLFDRLLSLSFYFSNLNRIDSFHVVFEFPAIKYCEIPTNFNVKMVLFSCNKVKWVNLAACLFWFCSSICCETFSEESARKFKHNTKAINSTRFLSELCSSKIRPKELKNIYLIWKKASIKHSNGLEMNLAKERGEKMS